MAKGEYAVVNGSTRKIKKKYAVINGVTRKIKKEYVVVDGKTRLCWNGGATWVINDQQGVRVSEDNGLTWSDTIQIPTGYTGAASGELAYRMINKDGKLYLYTFKTSGSVVGLYTSTDGSQWTYVGSTSDSASKLSIPSYNIHHIGKRFFSFVSPGRNKNYVNYSNDGINWSKFYVQSIYDNDVNTQSTATIGAYGTLNGDTAPKYFFYMEGNTMSSSDEYYPNLQVQVYDENFTYERTIEVNGICMWTGYEAFGLDVIDGTLKILIYRGRGDGGFCDFYVTTISNNTTSSAFSDKIDLQYPDSGDNPPTNQSYISNINDTLMFTTTYYTNFVKIKKDSYSFTRSGGNLGVFYGKLGYHDGRLGGVVGQNNDGRFIYSDDDGVTWTAIKLTAVCKNTTYRNFDTCVLE